ncbi:kinesin-like protein KIN-5C isoform X1 [Canna indica]|uniref:Kinesin-like protein KIN-5C isoform X1 n=1 Tax=Canna indica TaxID=4628 RepID=A0AAQ3QNF9_9LILI|nr:kinesin-like protein KIN-5C isoform X1 [Canna indica]
MGSRHEKDKAVNVQVLLRCRPFSDDELRSNAPQVVTCNEYQREVAVSQMIAGKQFDRVFMFDKVFGPSARQTDLYDQAVVPIVNEVLEGFNCTIFAYGQTGTGKTYTMEGECRKAKTGPKGQLPADAGVIPRAVKQIFDTLESQKAEYSVKVTFLELYNEEITDLLAPEELSKIALEERQKKPLPLMEDGKGGVLVRGLEEEIVTSADEIFSLLERGSAKRRTAETLLNKQSSRSHSLFSITIHIKEATPEGEELIKCGKLNLVDLAGSENISRSGAREGRAREAGEINKSLLTLGRVITALVEHLGHIPYRFEIGNSLKRIQLFDCFSVFDKVLFWICRDSKLTRLLRDSLGGRTKTCIIATVSPSVHCLEETLSTLDYAHRAKNIKNKPEVNQKMMKSTLIKDLYGEIDRLKAEVYAAREKVGVYIPKERYYQEESERKAMADQIEQMTVTIESNQKQFDDLQGKYNAELKHSADLTCNLEAIEKRLEQTSKVLVNVTEDMKQAQYALKEKDFIISEQTKAENALAHQASVLRCDLEKSLRENALLFSKIAREDKLNTANRSVVNNFQTELATKVAILCNTVAASVDRQNEYLKSVEKLCQSSLDFLEKATVELKKKVLASKSLFISHMEGVQNVVRLHKAGSTAGLEEMSSLIAANCCSLDQLLSIGEGEADQIFCNMQKILSEHRVEVAHFTQELRKRFNSSLIHVKEISEFIREFLVKFGEETNKLKHHSSQVHEAHAKCIYDFQKDYEEQSKVEQEKLLSDIASLVSSHMRRQKELVGVRLTSMGEAALENRETVEKLTSRMDVVTNDAKRKWDEFCKEAEHAYYDGSTFTAENHCRMEHDLQQCVSIIDGASQQWKKTHALASELSSKHAADMDSHIRTAIDCNEQHDVEVASARDAAADAAAKSSADIIQHFEGVIEREQECAEEVMKMVKVHSTNIREVQAEHIAQAADINNHADNTFHQDYLDYEPTGETPLRSEPDVPSKGMIESLRAMPMDALLEEFRENHPYSKEPKPSLIPRSPLAQRN